MTQSCLLPRPSPGKVRSGDPLRLIQRDFARRVHTATDVRAVQSLVGVGLEVNFLNGPARSQPVDRHGDVVSVLKLNSVGG